METHFLGGAMTGTWASHQRWPTVVVTSRAGRDQTALVSFGLISTDHFPPSLVPVNLQGKPLGATELGRNPFSWILLGMATTFVLSGSSVPQRMGRVA